MRNFRLDDESGHQEALFSWAAYQQGRMPELEYLHHVPNGGKRDKATATALKRQGVKAGVPDVVLPAVRAGYHGLYIELKAGKNTTTDNQKRWLEYLRQQGYYTAVCYSWQLAAGSRTDRAVFTTPRRAYTRAENNYNALEAAQKERQRMKTISILNLKGGVAKTFTAANMAYELYRRGYKVLLLDNDKQGNLSKAYGRYDAESIAPITRLLSGDWVHPDEIIQQTDYEGIDIVTANMSLFGATWNLTREESENQLSRYEQLGKSKIEYYGDCTVWGKYDYCIIDNPPDIGLNVLNALAITDEVIVPVKLDNYALEGLDIVAEQIEDIKAFNPAIKLAGVLVTSYQNTDGESAAVEWLEEQGKYNILGITRYSKKVAEHSFKRMSIYEYSPCCGAAQGYKKFVTAYTGKAR